MLNTLFFFFFKWTVRTLLNLTTAPTGGNPNHAAVTAAYVPSCLHPDFLRVLTLPVTMVAIRASPGQCLLDASSQPRPHPCSCSGMVSFAVLLLTCREEAGGGAVGQCV